MKFLNFVCRFIALVAMSLSLSACVQPEDLTATVKKVAEQFLAQQQEKSSVVVGSTTVSPTDAATDVTFKNVGVHGGQQTARIGQVGVKFATVERVNNNGKIPRAKKLKFLNSTPVVPGTASQNYSLLWVFLNKDLQVHDEEGPLDGRVQYWILYEEQAITVTFPDGYVGKGTGEVDTLYLAGDVSPNAYTASMKLSLDEVVYDGEIKGEILPGFTTTDIIWKPLPQVEAYWSKNQLMYPGQTVPIMSVSVMCPYDYTADKQESCELAHVEVLAVGLKDIAPSGFKTFNQFVEDDVTSFSTNFVAMPAGGYYEFVLTGYVTQKTQTVQVNRMVFNVGGVLVVPQVVNMLPITDFCGTVLSNLLDSACKSVPMIMG